MSRINNEQIREWVDNPVTTVLWYLCSRELSNTQEVRLANCLFRGDPQKTQEHLIEQAVKEDEWKCFLALLKGKFKDQLGDLTNYHKLVEDENEDRDEDDSE